MLRVMRCFAPLFVVLFLLSTCFSPRALAQKSYIWQEIRGKFEAANPALRAGQLAIGEAKAQETTAYLRPNPDLSIAADQFEVLMVEVYAFLRRAQHLVEKKIRVVINI